MDFEAEKEKNVKEIVTQLGVQANSKVSFRILIANDANPGDISHCYSPDFKWK